MAAAEDALSPVALFLYASKNCEDVLVWKSLDCCRWYWMRLGEAGQFE